MVDIAPEGACGHITRLVVPSEQFVRKRLDLLWIYWCHLGPGDRNGNRIGVDPYAAEPELACGEHRGAAAAERVQDPLPASCVAKQSERKLQWEHREVRADSVEAMSELCPGCVVCTGIQCGDPSHHAGQRRAALRSRRRGWATPNGSTRYPTSPVESHPWHPMPRCVRKVTMRE